MNTVPPPPRQVSWLALTAFVGGFASYGMAHLPDNVPWWVSWGMGSVLAGALGVVWLYQRKPGDDH